MPFRGGKILQGSVAVCGDRICYMTENGLYSFNGSVCSRLEGPRGEIDLTQAQGFCLHGKYAALVSLTDGKNALYVYDFSEKTGRFLLANGLISATKEYFLAGMTLYSFTESGGPPLGYESSLTLTLCSVPRALAWVRVEGTGNFGISTNVSTDTFAAEGDEKVHICAKKRLSETQISVTMKSDVCRIRYFEAAWRKENGN